MADRPAHIPTGRPVRTRIAPSPTGDPHVGTAYMGLVNTVLARQHGGQFLLRIDDTDRARYRAGSEDAIFSALRWLGLEWDEGPDKGGPHAPYRQSERTAIYREHAQMLLDAGKAYRCFCTEARLAEMTRTQKASKEKIGYDRLCSALAPDAAAERAKAEPFVVRLRVPTEGETTLHDLLRGPIVTRNDILQDQVLLKADGFPTYHLASCVDDHLMEITHIIRAEEWISSGPIHVLIFAAFGWQPPVFCHMPLLRNADKSKISKRKNPTSLLYYRDAGYLPSAMLNFLGLMGWGGPKGADGQQQEIFTIDEMRQHFALEQISLGGPVFDIEKLRYINANHMRLLPAERYHTLLKAWLFDDAKLKAIEALVQGRAETFGGFMAYADFFFGDVTQQPALLVPKKKTEDEQVAAVEDTWFVIGEVLGALERLEGWKTADIEAAIRALATEEATGWKPKDLFMTVRVAMTGKTNTPPLCESMEILGKARSLGRLGEALRALPEPSKKAQERREKKKREQEEKRRREQEEKAKPPQEPKDGGAPPEAA